MLRKLDFTQISTFETIENFDFLMDVTSASCIGLDDHSEKERERTRQCLLSVISTTRSQQQELLFGCFGYSELRKRVKFLSLLTREPFQV